MLGQLSCHSARLPFTASTLNCAACGAQGSLKPACRVSLSVVILGLFFTSFTLKQIFFHLNRLEA